MAKLLLLERVVIYLNMIYKDMTNTFRYNLHTKNEFKVDSMDHCYSATPQAENHLKIAGHWIKLQEAPLLIDVAQHCYVFA